MARDGYRDVLKLAANTLAAVAVICILGVFASGVLTRTEGEGNVSRHAAADRAYMVILDAGHGGPDGGAIGSKTKTPEAGLNLDVAMKVKELLEAEGVVVVMTRTDEAALGATKKADMQARKRILNTEDADIVASIHMNRFTDPSVNGPMTFYMKGSEEGAKLAKLVIDSVCEAIGRTTRQANPGDYFVIRVSPAPSVLVECGFLSNPQDEALLISEEHRTKLAEGIAKGILAYLKSIPKAD